jgi:hypothetical protein
MKTFSTLALLACLAAPAAGSTSSRQAAQTTATSTTTTTTTSDAPANVLGTWNATVTTAQGQAIPSEVTLKKEADKIVGTIGAQAGTLPVEAELKGKVLTISFTYQGQGGQAMPITLSGTVDGDTIKGTMSIAGQAGGEFIATRAKAATTATTATSTTTATTTSAAKTDLTGAWAVSLALDTITATPSVTLIQEGEKLTGDYVSQQYGKFPLTGSVKGSDVTFSVSMNIEGNGITAVYTGTIQPDGSLKGTVGLGDAMSGTFTATRKK